MKRPSPHPFTPDPDIGPAHDGRYTIDPVVVERAVNGDRGLRLTTRELWAAIDHLDRRGFSAAAISARLGITARTVHRQRARRRTHFHTGCG